MYLDCASARDDVSVFHGALHHHDCVVQTPLDFLDELLGAATEDECARLGLRALLEQVVPLPTDLSLLKPVFLVTGN